jgi:hypothetical protein
MAEEELEEAVPESVRDRADDQQMDDEPDWKARSQRNRRIMLKRARASGTEASRRPRYDDRKVRQTSGTPKNPGDGEVGECLKMRKPQRCKR